MICKLTFESVRSSLNAKILKEHETHKCVCADQRSDCEPGFESVGAEQVQINKVLLPSNVQLIIDDSALLIFNLSI